jgi:hypothetical protein
MAALAVLAVLAAAGCANPMEDLSKLTTRGYIAEDLVPKDREVGSWRASGKVRALSSRDFAAGLGERAAARLRYWDLAKSVAVDYSLGDTGRTVRLEIYDLAKPQGAFDVYSVIRERALRPPAAPADAADGKAEPRRGAARVTKVGVQGLLFERGGPADDLRAGLSSPAAGRVLVMWAERFVIRLVERGGGPQAAEAALLAFGEAVAGKLQRPLELAEVYVLQVPGEEANSERYEPRELLGRRELPSGVAARWKGRTGRGELFIAVFETSQNAGYAFEKLRRAAGGVLDPGYADGMFVGDLPGLGPVACFRRARAVAGLVGAAEAGERRDVLEEIRRRCSGEVPTPALPGGAGARK